MLEGDIKVDVAHQSTEMGGGGGACVRECMYVCVRACVWVCACVCEREAGRQRERERDHPVRTSRWRWWLLHLQQTQTPVSRTKPLHGINSLTVCLWKWCKTIFVDHWLKKILQVPHCTSVCLQPFRSEWTSFQPSKQNSNRQHGRRSLQASGWHQGGWPWNVRPYPCGEGSAA